MIVNKNIIRTNFIKNSIQYTLRYHFTARERTLPRIKNSTTILYTSPTITGQRLFYSTKSNAATSTIEENGGGTTNAVADDDVRTPIEEYDRLVRINRLRDDPHQRSIISSLSNLYESLKYYTPPSSSRSTSMSKLTDIKRKFLNIFNQNKATKVNETDVPVGIYLYGDVGCGKTMLMDLFYSTIPSHLSKKRIHFHQFMQYVHKRSHEIIKEHHLDDKKDVDSIPILANEISQISNILCFDEFQVTDVADAMILRRLLTLLLSPDKHGIVLFATSNRSPDELYINGVQRESFIPCIELIKDRTKVILLDSEVDYRKIPRPMSSVYTYPTKESGLKWDSKEFNEIKRAHIKEWYDYFAQDRRHQKRKDRRQKGDNNAEKFKDYSLTIWGREFKVPLCSPPRVAQFTFKELCGQPLAAGDYLALANNFQAFIITDIPYLTIMMRDEVRRFITFLDAVYDNGCKLATTGANDFTSLFVEPEDILNDYELKDSHSDDVIDKIDGNNDELVLKHGFSKEIAAKSHIFAKDEERFAFARALSRLSHMSSTDWVTK
ncbi:Afg1p NDAI_0C01110 [Naumovozyma dairenensis CBS 421]|uniref:AAA+ ATPase domain-containing protein n=1 Tax=Naumovozyma dairenensis (strain ATCC 10597 / BCRC 20456 / CBS 421 / NBRC 0211 / NRRL Y-12639) TaxID=1071378 RepID=G0W7L1_NAUDC|nr:hypothetical protein NDAI_0C01110 [Naumovozyma dairenensis CBS 421]CCD23772.1 hypothetical protein NDAI_0C01110 [Naumovozyma dairenensis CBS 421]